MADDDTGDEIGTIKMVNNYEVEWKIEDFFSYTGKNKYYYSPKFHNFGSRWNLQIYPNGKTSCKSVGWISLFLVRNFEKHDERKVCACFAFGVKRMDGKAERLGPECSYIFFKDFTGFGLGGWGVAKLLSRSVLKRKKSELATPQGTLSFICTLRTKQFFECTERYNALSRDFADLFSSKRGSDAILVVKGKEYAVHMTILSVRSSIFAAMFEADTEEKRTGRFEIEDCDPEMFEYLLRFLYTGKVKKEYCDRKAMERYKVAHKFKVPDLLSYCRLTIMYELWQENIKVLNVYKFAHSYDEKAIMFVAKEFFKKYCSQITRWETWETFQRENEALAKELLKGVTKKMLNQKPYAISDYLYEFHDEI